MWQGSQFAVDVVSYTPEQEVNSNEINNARKRLALAEDKGEEERILSIEAEIKDLEREQGKIAARIEELNDIHESRESRKEYQERLAREDKAARESEEDEQEDEPETPASKAHDPLEDVV